MQMVPAPLAGRSILVPPARRKHPLPLAHRTPELQRTVAREVPRRQANSGFQPQDPSSARLALTSCDPCSLGVLQLLWRLGAEHLPNQLRIDTRAGRAAPTRRMLPRSGGCNAAPGLLRGAERGAWAAPPRLAEPGEDPGSGITRGVTELPHCLGLPSHETDAQPS